MSKDINLIFANDGSMLRDAFHLKVVRIVAVVSLVFIIIISVSLFVFNEISGFQNVQQKEQAATQSISFFQKRIGELLLIKNRLKNIAMVNHSQSRLDIGMAQVVSGIPDNVRIDSFYMTNKNISITVISSSLASLNQFLDYVIGKFNKKQLFKTLKIDSLTADPKSQQYILSVEGDLM